MKIWPLLFNIISLQCNALSPSQFKLSDPFNIEGLFLVPQILVYCLYDAFIAHDDCISVFGTDRSHIRRIWGMRKDFESAFSRSSHGNLWLVGRRRRCPARTEHLESVILAPFLWFPSISASIRLHNMHHLSCALAQDNQSWSPLDYPKRMRPSPSLLNEPS